MVDGGVDYIRRSVNKVLYENMDVFDDGTLSMEQIREAFAWGSRGSEGGQSLTFILLKDLSTEHIKAILDTQSHISERIRHYFTEELIYREQMYGRN